MQAVTADSEQKNVMVSHRNVIANIMQIAVFESNHRNPDPEYCLGLLPFSHNLALVAVAHLAVYRGDGVVVLPGFDLQDTLFAIQQYQIGRLFLVGPSSAHDSSFCGARLVG